MIPKSLTLLLAAALLMLAPVSQALSDTCDITDLPCWGSGTKCNIKFRNKTGVKLNGKDSCCMQNKLLARDMKVEAQKDDGSRSGSNTLTISAGSSGTLNLDKKKDFWDIRMKASGVTNSTMSCSSIREVLQGGANCNVFIDASKILRWACNDGSVCAHDLC